MGNKHDFDLEISDFHTGKIYEGDETWIPRSSSLLLRRIPRLKAGSIELNALSFEQAAMVKPKSASGSPASTSTRPPAGSILPKAASPLRNGICHKCGVFGHFREQCPVNKSTHAWDRREGLRPAVINARLAPPPSFQIPVEVSCQLCNNLITATAVTMPCCGESCCQGCANSNEPAVSCRRCHEVISTTKSHSNQGLNSTVAAHNMGGLASKKREREGSVRYPEPPLKKLKHDYVDADVIFHSLPLTNLKGAIGVSASQSVLNSF